MTGSPATDALPPGLVLACYGDDFTGSAAVMEVLTEAGLPALLFLVPPTPEDLARMTGTRAVVVAGTARARSPAWMDANLPEVFAALGRLGAPVIHYKTCSTLDSSPDVGSIGRAVELGLAAFPAAMVPFLVAAPALRRYQCFGHLFAAAPGGVFRLDRHPVMAHHPVTPMDEAHVATHLGRQTSLEVGTLDIESLSSLATAQAAFEERGAAGVRLLCLDTLDAGHLAVCGGLIWSNRGRSRFCAGSQGVEYALVAHWRQQGLIPGAASASPIRPAKRIAVVSGSMSPVTARQIAWARANGFAALPLEAAAVIAGGPDSELAIDAAIDAACGSVEAGLDPIIYTGERSVAPTGRLSTEGINDRIGMALGRILDRVLERTGVRRAVIAGGDTSGIAAQTMGIRALSFVAPVLPGAPLCRVHADAPHLDGIEIALKGGQMGSEDYFGRLKGNS
jgi:uncharacterized protein YgbK (DUF1537 family)